MIAVDYALLTRVNTALAWFGRPVTLTELHAYGPGISSMRRADEIRQALNHLVLLGWATAVKRTEPFKHGGKRMQTWTYYSLSSMNGRKA
jgi:hypothetical protein